MTRLKTKLPLIISSSPSLFLEPRNKSPIHRAITIIDRSSFIKERLSLNKLSSCISRLNASPHSSSPTAHSFLDRIETKSRRISRCTLKHIRSKSHRLHAQFRAYIIIALLISKFHRILMELYLPFRGLSYRNHVMIHPSITNAGTRNSSI